MVADGIGLRTWHSGPHRGQPKLPKAVASMLERGLVEIGPGIFGRPHARFTAAGSDALRAMAGNRQLSAYRAKTVGLGVVRLGPWFA